MKYLKLSVTVLLAVMSLVGTYTGAYAQANPNTITFDNQSGKLGLVKLLGPTGRTVEVPEGDSRTVNVAAGEYYILTRFGSAPGTYTYMKGKPFAVKQTSTQYSVITITLHKVVSGNYRTTPISSAQFDNTAVSAPLTTVHPAIEMEVYNPQTITLPRVEIYEPQVLEMPRIEVYNPPPLVLQPLKVYTLPLELIEPQVFEVPRFEVYNPPPITFPRVELYEPPVLELPTQVYTPK